MKSTKNQISILTIILFSILLIIIPSNVYAEEIEVKSFSLDETAILQVTNYSNESLDMFRIWLGNDNNFKSFKTEKGWSGEKTPQGVIIFTSTKSLEPQETVKFGIKTDEVNSGINWKGLNKKSGEINVGKTFSEQIPQVIKKQSTNQNFGEGIKIESTFRIIPEKPNVGSLIRVTGEGFGIHHEFEFYIDTHKIDNFTTDDKGHFITTMNIPNEIEPGRVDFKIKDDLGLIKKISLRIGEPSNRIIEKEDIRLTIQNVPKYIHRGGIIDIFGTAAPGSILTTKIFDPNNEAISIKNVEVDNKGEWNEKQLFIIPLNAVYGKYSIYVSDGNTKKIKSLIVESDKIINIVSSNEKFEQGEKMEFSGTAKPNEVIGIIIQNPIGSEIFVKNFQVGNSGEIEFEHQTELAYLKGTYTIIMTQGDEKEKIFVGLGQLPDIPIGIELDKTNYNTGEIANITLTGKALEIINLLIIDPSSMAKGESIPITLQENGKATYQLDLQNYNSGIYTAQVSKGNSENAKPFAVGLQTGSGEISINTTKMSYIQGESILLLGETGKNAILVISFLDPDGKIVKEKEIFSDKNGIISDNSFRIPDNAVEGTWKVNIKSGPNFDSTDIQVIKKNNQGMVMIIEKGEKISAVGETITIKITGAQQTVIIKIIDEDKELIEKLTLQASSSGEINIPWLVQKDLKNTIITIIAEDSINSIQSDYKIQ